MDTRIDERGNLDASASGSEAVKAQALVIAEHIRSQLIMRLGLYGLAAIFVTTASLLVVFAPDGRETVTVIIAIALFALAVGAAGFGTFSIKTPIVSADAGASPSPSRPDRQNSPSSRARPKSSPAGR